MNASDQVVMHGQYADSDSKVNTCHGIRIRTLAQNGAKLMKVVDKPTKPKEPDPVSEFIRFLIEDWEAKGAKLYVLAERAGLAKSMPSQIKARTSDASFYSAAKFANAFGFRDLPELVTAAYAWWRSSDRTMMPNLERESALAEALRLAESYSVTKEQIDRMLRRFPEDENLDEDPLWWLSKLHEIRSEDATKAAKAMAAQRQEEWEKKQVAKTIESAYREASKLKKQAEDMPSSAPPAPASERAAKPRKSG